MKRSRAIVFALIACVPAGLLLGAFSSFAIAKWCESRPAQRAFQSFSGNHGTDTWFIQFSRAAGREQSTLTVQFSRPSDSAIPSANARAAKPLLPIPEYLNLQADLGDRGKIETLATGWPLLQHVEQRISSRQSGVPSPTTLDFVLWPALITNSLVLTLPSILLLACLIFFPIVAMRFWKYRRFSRRGLCPFCSFDRNGQPIGSPCTECGR